MTPNRGRAPDRRPRRQLLMFSLSRYPHTLAATTNRTYIRTCAHPGTFQKISRVTFVASTVCNLSSCPATLQRKCGSLRALPCLQQLTHLGDGLEEVRDEAEVRHLEDRRFGVLVDRDDRL